MTTSVLKLYTVHPYGPKVPINKSPIVVGCHGDNRWCIIITLSPRLGACRGFNDHDRGLKRLNGLANRSKDNNVDIPDQ